MNGFFFQNQVGIACFISIILAIAVSNLFFFKRMRGEPAERTETPRASILVPARNEEGSVAECLEALLAQDYPDFEVILLDDGSTDRTCEIAASLAVSDGRLRVVKGGPLPEGWNGKNWACWQLAELSEGELIFFTDADTLHSPGALSAGVGELLGGDIDFLSAFPREVLRSPSEVFSIPILAFSLMCFMPLGLAFRLRSPSLSSAIGQYMLFRRSSYMAMGGHSSIRDSVLDDFDLAGRTKACGYRWRLVDGSEYSRCRMYHDYREVLGGLGKNLFAVFGCHVALFIFVWCWMALAFLSPPILLILGAAGVSFSTGVLVSAAINIALSLALWSVVVARFRLPWYLVPFYPVSIANWVLLSFASLFMNLSGRSSWKGRRLVKPKIHWI